MKFLIFVAVFSIQTIFSYSEPLRSSSRTQINKRDDDISFNEIGDSFDELRQRDFNTKVNRVQKKQVDSSSETDLSSSTIDPNSNDESNKGTSNNDSGCEFLNNVVQQGVQVLGALINDMVNIVTKLCTNSNSLLGGTGRNDTSISTTTAESSSSFAETLTSTDNPNNNNN